MQVTRRQALLATLGAAMGAQDGAGAIGEESGAKGMADLASGKHRQWWLHHPTVGDPSWDTFARESGNPIHVGAPPYEWPVNGYLFRDPPSGRWYCYPSIYPRGYWAPPGSGKPWPNSLIMREKPGGGWEELGMVFLPPKPPFVFTDGVPGAMTDVCVVYDRGQYHLIYGWCDGVNKHGGLAYAVSDRPEGPFRCAQTPIHDELEHEPIMGVYVRAYASTLLRRKSDWLIIHMMSTPGNGGGQWALFGMRSASAGGPYSAPEPLLYPESDRFHPAIAEFFPAFVHRGVVYAPATSLARNRSFQVIFRAPLEEAHRAEEWSIHQYGSVWHAEENAWEAQGIWGQTFSAQVAPDGVMRAMFPAKTLADVGTTNIARRPWSKPYRDGFIVSAPNAPVVAVLRGESGDFDVKVRGRANGSWALCFGCAGPLGPDRNGADSLLHPLVRTGRAECRIAPDRWSAVQLDAAGHEQVIARGAVPAGKAPGFVRLTRTGERATLEIEGVPPLTWDSAPAGGRIELLAEAGTILHVDAFGFAGKLRPGWEPWLAVDALAGQACAPGEWVPADGPGFRFGVGWESGRAGVRAKWNVDGQAFRLWAPKGPGYGACTVLVDGHEVGAVDLRAPEPQGSSVVLERKVAPGRHAIAVVASSGVVPCDSLDVLQPALRA